VELDVRPAQVLVQAVIVELSESSTERLGIQWGMVEEGDASTTTIGPVGVGVGIIRAGNFRALISAVKGISNADILSQPTIVVLDNKEATFSVGKQVSVINSSTGAANAATSTGIPFTTSSYDRQNVGLELNVTPQIGQGNVVQLLIEQKNDTLQNPNNPGDKPIVNNSKIKTHVIVNSGDILVLGGLMSNSMTDSMNKTPLLGDIPVIGNIFNSKDRTHEKKNLLVFIYPIILKTPTDGTRISEERYNTMRDTQRYWHENWLSDKDDPRDRELPPRHTLLQLPNPFGE
jgi:general secretion pathway protein D